METTTPAVEHSPTLERQFHFARLRSYAGQFWFTAWALVSDPLVRAWDALARAWRWLRQHPTIAWILIVLALGGVAAWPIASIRHNRIPIEARRLMGEGRLAEARDLLRYELRHSPEKGELHLLLGHVLHRIPGQAAASVDAYSTAHGAAAILDDEALANLADDLGLERATADRASHLLVRIGPSALPAILAAAQDGPGPRRLRALGLARDLGAEESIDRVAAYGALLKDSDCELRRAAARRLGEIGDPAALPALLEAAKASRGTKTGLFGRAQRAPACGAADAAEAVKRIEALHPAPGR
jgi:serine/threonine-protein kinase